MAVPKMAISPALTMDLSKESPDSDEFCMGPLIDRYIQASPDFVQCTTKNEKDKNLCLPVQSSINPAVLSLLLLRPVCS